MRKDTRDGPKKARDRETVRLRLLGGFSVSVGGRTVDEDAWRLKKAASLVKLLALEPGHKMHRERVMDLLWPDLDAKAQTNNLRQVLHVARRTLDPTRATASLYLRPSGDLLALCPGVPLWVDVEAFEDAVAFARRSGEPAAYGAALDLYAGELLPGDRYEKWAEERRAGLLETYLALIFASSKIHEERGEAEEAIGTLRRALVVESPPEKRFTRG